MRTPAEVFPPGGFIREELDARQWTQADLAGIMGRPLRTINELVNGKKALTPDTAVGLGAAFGTSPDYWLNLENSYRLSQVKRDGDEVALKAKLFSAAPVNEMIRREWIEGGADAVMLEQQVLRFLEAKSLDEKFDLPFAARASVSYPDLTPAHRAWLCRARKLARAVGAAAYRPDALDQGLAALRPLIGSEHEVRRVPALLAEIGIRLVIVEHLPGTRLDGAALWLEREKKPAVALTMRYDRIDAFWFTLCHELMHIKHKDAWSLDDALVGNDALPTNEKPDFEQRADREAAEILIPQEELDSFIMRVRPLYSKRKIVHFANRIRIHPGIIVGQLQRRGEIKYSHSREMLAKVRDSLTEAALSDGWGTSPRL